MSYLVANPEDRVSRVETHMYLNGYDNNFYLMDQTVFMTDHCHGDSYN